MNKALKIALPIAGGLAAAAAAAFLIAPARADGQQKAAFFGRNIAHRGLHTKDASIPENSLEAFEAAIDAGYGIELDVHITADGKIVVFHDDELSRMCGESLRIESLSYAEIQKFRLAGTNSKIPLLSEVLSLVSGAVPIVLELKRGGRNRELCARGYELVGAYTGEVCVESFDPLIVRWWRKNAPEIMRGQLSPPYQQSRKCLDKFKAFVFANLLTNFLSRPHFIAYGINGKKPPLVKLCEKMGAMRVAWTSRDWINELDSDMVIFEYYRPKIRYTTGIPSSKSIFVTLRATKTEITAPCVT